METIKQKEPMRKGSIRLPKITWEEIELLQVRLGLSDKSECLRVALSLGLAQLKERRA